MNDVNFTDKDLLYISDMFEWNKSTLQLIDSFLEEIEDEEVREVLEEVFSMHYENLNKCISILEGNHQEEKEYYEDEDECDEDCEACGCKSEEDEDERDEEDEDEDDESEQEEDERDEDE